MELTDKERLVKHRKAQEKLGRYKREEIWVLPALHMDTELPADAVLSTLLRELCVFQL